MLQDRFLDRRNTGVKGQVSKYGGYWYYRPSIQIGWILGLQGRFLDEEDTGVTGQVSR